MSKVILPLRNQHVPFILSPVGDREKVDQVPVVAQTVAMWRKRQITHRLGSLAAAAG